MNPRGPSIRRGFTCPSARLALRRADAPASQLERSPMTLDKLKGPAIAAAAALMISGASTVLASGPAARPAVLAAPAVAAATEPANRAETAAAPDADNVQATPAK